MHVLMILRKYLGLTQKELAAKAGVSFADVNEIENKPGYGMIGKYCKLSEYLHVPVHTLVMNDVNSVPEDFFRQMRAGEYIEPPDYKNGRLGRAGEERVFGDEQKRLLSLNPCLSKLVIPNYKLKSSKGYDIISYSCDGVPYFIEVKTSEKENTQIQLTGYEYETASKLTDQGYDYWIYSFSGWGTENERFEKVLFSDLRKEQRIEPARYICDLRPRKKKENGLLHFRRKTGLSQSDAASLLEIPASCLCKYETGENQCPVTAYQKMSKLYQVKIDELLQEYPAENCG